MPRPKLSPPSTLIVSLCALLLVGGAFVSDLFGARQRQLDAGAQQLDYHSRMLAEHVARSVDSIEILLDELRPQISEMRPWWSWTPQEGHEVLRSRLTRSLPAIRHLLVFDAEGRQRFTSFALPPPQITVADRPYFARLRDGAGRSHYGPYVGRNSKRPTYAIARRLDFPDGAFAGALMVAIEPDYFEEFCASTRPYEEFEAALVNAGGRIISRCRPTAERGGMDGSGEDFRRVLAGGVFTALPDDFAATRFETPEHILAVAPAPGHPDLRVVSAAPKARLLAQWRAQALQSALLGAAALVALGLAGLMIRRQVRDIRRYAKQLQTHRDTLAARVHEATAELEERRRDAEVMAEAKSRFLAAASHDLRQPLQALRLFAGRLGKDTEEEERELLGQRIRQAVEAMSEQLEGLLQLSRLDMSNVEAQPVGLPVEQLFAKLAATYCPLADAFGVRLVFSARERIVHSDPVLLARLLGNLIHNAIKFSPHGTVLVCARWGAAGATRIEVRDNGAGIAEKYQKAIFEEFFQLKNRAREAHAGLGLGLSIVSRIARLLDTPIELRSRSGAGAAFALRLPAAPASAAGQPASSPAAEAELLLIGPPRSGCRTFAKRAAEWGYRVAHADDVAAARPLLAAGAIAIAFPDARRNDPDELASLLIAHPGIVIHPEGEDISGAGPYHLSLPLKPASVRALLRSLHAASLKKTLPS